MRKHLIASVIATAMFALCGAGAGAADVIKFGVAAEPYPPFDSKDASGKWVGFEIELMDAVCAEIKTKCELVEVAWDGIIPALQEKKIDVIWSSMSITDERRKVIDFTDKYYNTPSVVIGAKGQNIEITPAGLTGKIIGTETATTHANYAQKYYTGANIKLYDTFDNANADLVAGRVDVVIGDLVVLEPFLKSDQGKGLEIKAQLPDDPLLGDGIGGGVRKSDSALRNKLNAAIKSVRQSGKYNEIAKKYFDFDIYGGTS
jgi:polar amino acid transport system substrate-binding protein